MLYFQHLYFVMSAVPHFSMCFTDCFMEQSFKGKYLGPLETKQRQKHTVYVTEVRTDFGK